jgi:hypothetical protein
MARTPDLTGDAIYETTVYSYGKKYFVTGRYPNATTARKDAPRHFRGKVTTRAPRLVRDLSPAGAVITEDMKK